ncbi:MAG: ABC transporter permease subunit [Oscillospiraceae bacterium]
MKTSTSQNKLSIAAAAIFWVVVWQVAAMLIGEQLFLPSPLSVLARLFSLFSDADFYKAIAFSMGRITLGFAIGALLGTAMAVLAYKIRFFHTLFLPLVGTVKAAPVASFAVIALLMVGSKNLAVLVSALMVLPVFYTNLQAGMLSVERERFEAAAVFGMIRRDRFRFIYLPYVAPFAKSACELGLGIAWKAGVAAEVIGIAAGSIGGKIYDAKVSLDTEELFAYTLVVVALSIFFERLTLAILKQCEKALTR